MTKSRLALLALLGAAAFPAGTREFGADSQLRFDK
jgi:hypothetical protein